MQGYATTRRPSIFLPSERVITNRWYPWYGSGLGFGFASYGPWGYGYRSSLWYDPYLFYPYDDPFGLYGPAYGYGVGGGYGYVDDDRGSHETETGSIRLRAKPREARVYVDGALVGIVDEFDGLTHHLDLEAGRHQLELRADGFQPYTTEVLVESGRTITERVTLKKP